jgi:outer membrane protein assembly factor BamA
MRLAYDASPKVAKFLSNQTLDADARYYVRLGENGTLALRARGFKSWGVAPNYTFFGGNSEMRGYDYREFIGHKAFYANAELRFPLVVAMATPLGVLGGIRGVFFGDIGGAGLAGSPFKLYNRGSEVRAVQTSQTSKTNYRFNGFRLVDAKASYGIGLETFALGFPVHFDWSYRTLFNKGWEDYLYQNVGGSAKFRKPRFTAWIGYDF